ncbi:MAG TPA: tetratricopeptide repeat protein [Blastocatellia bacterium]|nr:tetratricopeptide repeat protein [Blastocatellia bacterium]
MGAVKIHRLSITLLISSVGVAALAITPLGVVGQQASTTGKPAAAASSEKVSEFERLRIEGNEAVYNLEYKSAREMFAKMTTLEPEHPAGYVYLANNLWLETLNAHRRLSTSVYTGESFYSQGANDDKVDPKRDAEFTGLIKQAIAAARARITKNPRDVEAIYYQASALGLRAAYTTSVKRSFRRAIGDANDSVQMQRQVIKVDPEYIDSYLSIGLYEYVIDSLPIGWKVLARLAGLKGSKKKGIEHLELVTQRGKYAADDARVVLIGLYSKQNQPEKAVELITQLATKYPRNYLFGVERAGMLYKLGRKDEAARVFGELLKDASIAQSATDLVRFQWGESLRDKGDYAAAIEQYSEVKRWSKSDPELISLAHLHTGEALDVLGKREQALAEYQVVLKREDVFGSHKLASQYVKKAYSPAKT